MTQLQCVKCGKLWRDPVTPGPCGIRTGGTTWCDGELVEHQCGGPSEACMMKGCEECGGESLTSLAELRIERDALRARVAELEAELARIAELSAPPVVPEGWEVGHDGEWKLWLVNEGEDFPDSLCAYVDRDGWLCTCDGEPNVAPWPALVALEYAHRTGQRPSHAGDKP